MLIKLSPQLQNKFGMTVICDRGGMTAIPVQSIPRETRVLIVSAPEGNPNRFNRLQLQLFSKFDALEELHLTGSISMRKIGTDTFYDLGETLKVLNVSNNAIDFIIENDFRKLHYVTELYLDNNYVSTINFG